jgi:hypothetical protein
MIKVVRNLASNIQPSELTHCIKNHHHIYLSGSEGTEHGQELELDLDYKHCLPLVIPLDNRRKHKGENSYP